LLKIGQLKAHAPEAAEIERLLIAARRNLRGARVTTISPETRFDVAYKAMMQSALAALMMHGYRPDTNRPGHHMTVIQTLPLTIGVESELSCWIRYGVNGTSRTTRVMTLTKRRRSTALSRLNG